MQIEMLSPADLTPYANNARTHSEDQVRQIAASIEQFGFANPILAGDDGVIVAGHGRHAAALVLGLEAVPVIKLSHLSEAQRRALVIADNRIAENAGWDEALLAREIAALVDQDFAADLMGMTQKEAARLIASITEELDGGAVVNDPDRVPEVKAIAV